MVNQIAFEEEQYVVLDHVFAHTIYSDLDDLSHLIINDPIIFEEKSHLNPDFVLKYIKDARKYSATHFTPKNYIIGRCELPLGDQNDWKILSIDNLDQVENCPYFKSYLERCSVTFGFANGSERTFLFIITYLISRETMSIRHSYEAALKRAGDPTNFVGLPLITYENETKYKLSKLTVGAAKDIIIPVEKHTTITIEKENNAMDNTFKFDFGPVNKDTFKMSPFGIAVRNAENKWVTYNSTDKMIVEVDGFCFDFDKMLMKMPVALSEVKTGDIILHNKKPVFVEEIQDKNLSVVDLSVGENKIVIPSINMFGFNFITKIVSFISIPQVTPNKDQPFGNIMPYLMMSSIMGADDNKNMLDDGMMKMMMFSSMMGGQNIFANMLGGTFMSPNNTQVSQG